jgi:uncharacterized pyridoxal phosphate-dependent enzyme
MKNNIYSQINIRPLINAWGTHSYIGGSRPHPEVVEAMKEASRYFVNTYELEKEVGKKIAKLTRNEAAFVTVSAAAGLLLSAAAIMAGTDEKKRAQLPNTQGMKNETLVLTANKNPYYICVLPAGMKVRWIGDPYEPKLDEIENAIGENTASFLCFPENSSRIAGLEVKEIVQICHDNSIPVIVDAAALIPPFENTWTYTRDLGADLAIFSGGKGLRGPQSSGFVVGKQKFIDMIMFFCPPLPYIARPAKASRELIMGLLKAVEIMAASSLEEIISEIENRADYIYKRLQGIPGIKIKKHFCTDKKPFNHLRVFIDKKITGLSSFELARTLDEGNPRIVVGEPSYNAPWVNMPKDGIIINAETLTFKEAKVVSDKIIDILLK